MFNMSLPSIKVSRIIQAAPEKVWDMLTDTTRWTEWGPTVRAVQSETRYIEAAQQVTLKRSLDFGPLLPSPNGRTNNTGHGVFLTSGPPVTASK
jgi:carbon monoxide dehydrogenase subunit G